MKRKIGLVSLLSVSLLAACGNNPEENNENVALKIGVVGDASAEIWGQIAENVKSEGVDLEVIIFTDYVQPNVALKEGDIDLNAFQHLAFLREFVNDSNEDLVPIAYTSMSPVLVFGTEEINDVADIPEGAQIGISNSATNAERAFLALEDIGLIELADDVGFAPTIDDIETLHKNIELVELDPQQVARTLGDTDIVLLGSDMTLEAGFDPNDAIYVDIEDAENNILNPLKKNAVVVRREDKDNEAIQKVAEAYQTEKISKLVEETTASFPNWEEGDTPIEDFDAALNE